METIAVDFVYCLSQSRAWCCCKLAENFYFVYFMCMRCIETAK